MSTKQKSNILVLLILTGLVFSSAIGYWWWVKSTALPVLGEIESFTLETAEGKPYQPKNNKVKLVMFYEENCNANCQSTLNVMESLQNSFKEEQLLGKEVELLSIIMSSGLKEVEKYQSSHKIDSNGWRFLTGSSKELDKVKKQIMVSNNEKEDNSTYQPEIYLIDKKGRIRGNYQVAEAETVDLEIIREDVKNLVRVQPTE